MLTSHTTRIWPAVFAAANKSSYISRASPCPRASCNDDPVDIDEALKASAKPIKVLIVVSRILIQRQQKPSHPWAHVFRIKTHRQQPLRRSQI